MRTLAILVPSHTADDLLKHLLNDTSLAEIRRFHEYKINVVIGIAGQGAFVKAWPEITKMTLNVMIKAIYVPEENPARLTFLRQTAANQWPDVDYYLLVDHNLEFQPGSARRYAQAIYFLEGWRDVAMIFCGSKNDTFGEMIVPYKDAHNSTSRGIVVRNDQHGQLFPPDTLKLKGSGDESVLAVAANIRGLWVYKQWNNPSLHYPLECREFLERGKTIKNNVHNWDVVNENCFRWVRQQLGIPEHVDLYGMSFVNSYIKPRE